MEDKLHKWELAGLGKAPFKVVCIIELPARKILEQNPSTYNNLMNNAQIQASRFGVSLGTCDVCSTALTINFVIQDADNKHFVCGSECVKKSGDLGLINKSTMLKNERLKLIRNEKAKIEWEAKRLIWEAKQEALRVEAEARESLIDSIMIPLKAQLEESHKWLTDVLDKHDWNFCTELSNKLKNKFQPLEDYHDRVIVILCDIYSKDSGRANSKKYLQAQEKFESLSITSSEKVNSLKKELDNKLSEV
jgi:hypothetical protein